MLILILSMSLSQMDVRQEYTIVVKSAARHYNLDWKLLDSLIYAESNWNPKAVSSAGAEGLTQLMPKTARYLGVKNSFNPAQAIWGAALYLKQLNSRFNNWRLTLAAYNAGPTRVGRCNCVPRIKETQNYVNKVLRLWGRFNDSYKAKYVYNEKNNTMH